ncbi:MAG: hypothetical protein B6U88_00865 [Candidatus Aenigmarchaeota archaeon ex4484_56]|nr:MAG: hypothetical protein B6U88_00865 [Candidatus Aenigmarchaeota archaeon ex4484_56]
MGLGKDRYLLKKIENILIEKRNYIFKMPENENVVVLASGGMDSTMTIATLLGEFNVNVYPLFIRRGQRAQRFEEKSINYFTKFFTKKYPNKFFKPFKVCVNIPCIEFKKYLPKKKTN